MKINQYIDHTLLKATATKAEIKEICEEAKKYDFYAVCVNGSYVPEVKEELKGSNVNIAAVIGFPLGAMSTKAKVFEAEQAVRDGATEIDMVIQIGKLIDGDYEYVENDIREIKKAIGNNVLKVIIETCYLTDDQKKKACELALNAKADYVKTSTGFGTGGATYEDVKLMKDVVKDNAKVKASGGVKDYETAEKYIELGASRLGTSSGVKIIEGEKVGENDY
jgi:deoxyribose-phosphate aldolase